MILEIVFTGICAFAPNGKGGAVAIMPDARNAHGHLVWMVVDKPLYLGDPADFMSIEDTACERRGAIALSPNTLGEAGRLSITGTSDGQVVYFGPPTNDNAPKPSNQSSIRWAAKFPAILKEQPRLKPEFEKPSNLTAFWYELPSGVLTSNGASQCVWRMKKKKELWARSKHALAQEVILTTRVPSMDVMDIEIGGRKYQLNVKNQSHVRVMFGNTPADQIFPTPQAPEDVDEHFGIYYSMLANPSFQEPDDWRVPHKEESAACDEVEAEPCPVVAARATTRPLSYGFRRIGGANCPPVFMFEPALTP